jgi:hypothetical protein
MATTNSLTSPAIGLASQAAKAGKTDNRGPLDRVHIEPATNGYMVTTHFEPKPTKGKGPATYPEPERNVFTSHGEASAHVASILAAHAASQPGAPGPKAA